MGPCAEAEDERHCILQAAGPLLGVRLRHLLRVAEHGIGPQQRVHEPDALPLDMIKLPILFQVALDVVHVRFGQVPVFGAA